MSSSEPFKINKDKIKEADIIEIDGGKVVVYSSTKDYLDVIPFEYLEKIRESEGSSTIFLPKIRIRYPNPDEYEKTDGADYFWMLNSKNKIVQNLLKVFLNEKE